MAEDKIEVSGKVKDFITEGCYTTRDLRACILTAARIQKDERDELKVSIDGRKYTILGRDAFGTPFYT